MPYSTEHEPTNSSNDSAARIRARPQAGTSEACSAASESVWVRVRGGTHPLLPLGRSSSRRWKPGGRVAPLLPLVQRESKAETPSTFVRMTLDSTLGCTVARPRADRSGQQLDDEGAAPPPDPVFSAPLRPVGPGPTQFSALSKVPTGSHHSAQVALWRPVGLESERFGPASLGGPHVAT